MRSSNKVIKAAAVVIAPQCPLTPFQDAEPNGDAGWPHSPDVNLPPGRAADKASRAGDERVRLVRQEAYDRGMAEGLKKGAAQQKQELAKLASTLSGLINELTREKKEFFQRMEREVLNLAFAIAEKVLSHETATDKDVICKVLAGTLKRIADQEGIRIRLNPEDYRHLLDRKADVFPGLEAVKADMLEADAAIGRGGAVIDSPFGEVDARLDRQLSELKEALSGR